MDGISKRRVQHEATPLLPGKTFESRYNWKVLIVLDNYFRITERGSTFWLETQAGLTTFLTMSYIVIVNPLLMASSGLDKNVCIAGTCIASAVTSFLVGVFGNLPVGCAPGIGLTAYFTYGLVGGVTTAEQALAISMLSGLIMVILTLSGLANMILNNIPRYIKSATIVGMGLLISLIGMVDLKLVVPGTNGSILSLGDLSRWNIWLAIFALVAMCCLHYKEFKSGCLLTIVLVSLIVFGIENSWPSQIVSVPAVRSPVQLLDFHFQSVASVITGIISFILVLLFDVSGVIYGCAKKAALVNEDNKVPGQFQSLLSVSVGSILASFVGCSPIIIGVESMSGIAAGGRTGFTAVVVSFMFALSLVIGPLLGSVPVEAYSPVLMFVGVIMMEQVKCINWSHTPEALPAFFTIAFMSFTYSIANGVFAGLFFLLVMKAIHFTTCGRFLHRMSVTPHDSTECDYEELNDAPTEDPQEP